VNLFFVLVLAFSLSMDAFAVAVGLSLGGSGLGRRQALRLSFHFGLFQFGMPVLGWTAGRTVLKLIEAYDHWVAAGLLVFVGGKMAIEALRQEKKRQGTNDPTRGLSLILLSLATSIDSLAAGISLAALGAPLIYPAAIIGVVCFGVSLTGTRVGPVLGRIAGKWAEISGGAVLVAIAVKILADHL